MASPPIRRCYRTYPARRVPNHGNGRSFRQSTLENWQSEFRQLSAFTIACAFLVDKGRTSPRTGAASGGKLDVLLERYGLDPLEVDRTLRANYQRRRRQKELA